MEDLKRQFTKSKSHQELMFSFKHKEIKKKFTDEEIRQYKEE